MIVASASHFWLACRVFYYSLHGLSMTSNIDLISRNGCLGLTPCYAWWALLFKLWPLQALAIVRRVWIIARWFSMNSQACDWSCEFGGSGFLVAVSWPPSQTSRSARGSFLVNTIVGYDSLSRNHFGPFPLCESNLRADARHIVS